MQFLSLPQGVNIMSQSGAIGELQGVQVDMKALLGVQGLDIDLNARTALLALLLC